MTTPKFTVGAFVVSKANREAIRLGAAQFGSKGMLVMQVLEIVQETSSAGKQNNYLCRVGTLDGIFNELVLFAEVELDIAPTDPLPPQ